MVIADGSRHAVSPRCSSAEFVIVFTSEMRTSPLSELLQQKHPIEFAKGSIMSQSNTSPSLVQLLKTHQKRQTDIKRQNGVSSMTTLHWNAVWHDMHCSPILDYRAVM